MLAVLVAEIVITLAFLPFQGEGPGHFAEGFVWWETLIGVFLIHLAANSTIEVRGIALAAACTAVHLIVEPWRGRFPMTGPRSGAGTEQLGRDEVPLPVAGGAAGDAMREEIYRRLADHLDQLPGGFAPSDTGAELRVLQRLFTPTESELATHLTLDPETASAIAERAGLPADETEQRLAEMARKGLIFSIHVGDGSVRYHAVPFVVGIYEFQVNNLSEELLGDLADYWRTMKPRPEPASIPQMRTIPVGRSIKPHLEALPYEQVDALVKAQSRYAVAPCICRRKARLAGRGCDAPEESCLMFGDWADYYVRNGLGRYIDQAEVGDLLARADAANLVLQPTNSRDVSAICCCCGCCCGILMGLQRHPNPSAHVASAFIAELEPAACQGCGVCVERCQMQALAFHESRVTLHADRCIGCGLCVTTCPSGALTLRRKPERERDRPPGTIGDTWRTIARARGGAG